MYRCVKKLQQTFLADNSAILLLKRFRTMTKRNAHFGDFKDEINVAIPPILAEPIGFLSSTIHESGPRG